jgi:hypothetical protein
MTSKEIIKKKLERLGACGMGYPSEGLPCIRPAGHDNPESTCFAMIRNRQGAKVGCFMVQDGKEWITDESKFPTDIVVSTPLYHDGMREEVQAVPDRRGLVAHSRGKS